ncbi:hypothetical protein [Treponema sp.]|uniref:hypothetical protein n=1 Tax=Treponema sp. TaxID=166 RepID=UPI003FD81E10
MKKIFALFVAAALGTAIFAQTTTADPTIEALNAQTAEERATQVIKIEDKYADLHPKTKSVNLELEYTPLTGEVRFYYTCMAASYDQGEAMNTAMAVYENFAKENKFKHYSYKGKDKTKYFKDDRNVRMATYVSYVVFTR